MPASRAAILRQKYERLRDQAIDADRLADEAYGLQHGLLERINNRKKGSSENERNHNEELRRGDTCDER